MPVDEDEFKRVIGNMLRMPPKKHADSKLGTKKRVGKLIPPQPTPKREDQVGQPDCDK
jgi:hypothetical protein